MILSILVTIVCDAQIFIKSSEQTFVEEAVKPGLFISKQSFQICDKESGELFGLNGKQEFGTQYTVGIKIAGGYILTDAAVRPWLYNGKFERFREKYDPVFYQASYAMPGSKIKYDELDYDLTRQEEIFDETLYKFSSQIFGNKGFVLDDAPGKKNGWVIWLMVKRDTDFEKSVELNFAIFRRDIEVDKDHDMFDVDSFYTDDEILGGIYVVPYYPNIGVLEFRLGGIMAKFDNRWKILCPFVAEKPVAAAGGNKNSEDSNAELTPVERAKEALTDSKKKKK